MLSFHAQPKVFVATAPCDLRLSFHGLWAAAQERMGEEAREAKGVVAESWHGGCAGERSLDHRRLRGLGGLAPCQLHHDPRRRLRLHAATRGRIFRDVLEEYWQYVECMPERTRHHHDAAWRPVVESWLRRQGRISVRDNRHPKSANQFRRFLPSY